MKTLQVGIMSRGKFQSRVIEIAAGRYIPKKNEPKIWFSSIKSLCCIFCPKMNTHSD